MIKIREYLNLLFANLLTAMKIHLSETTYKILAPTGRYQLEFHRRLKVVTKYRVQNGQVSAHCPQRYGMTEVVSKSKNAGKPIRKVRDKISKLLIIQSFKIQCIFDMIGRTPRKPSTVRLSPAARSLD